VRLSNLERICSLYHHVVFGWKKWWKMKIALIAGGHGSIPPQGWGAVENLIWNYKLQLEALGHTVDIYNTFIYQEIICSLHSGHYDFVHSHYAPFCLPFNKHLRTDYCTTVHSGNLANYIRGMHIPEFDITLADVLESPGNIALSEPIRDLYVSRGYRGFLRVLRNAVETEKFCYMGSGNGKVACLGRIEPRKQQALLADLLKDRVEVDFVGPRRDGEEPNFHENATCRHLGSWSKEEVYQKLTNYSCLVLYSQSEAAPLVVLEGLAAGLSIVVTESASANLTNEEFITIIPDDERNPDVLAGVIQQAIDKNAGLRKEIRAYARERFDYSAVVQDYLELIAEFKDYASAERESKVIPLQYPDPAPHVA
jgi:glycosyltransferase involved in cell wall biosynthesis